MMRRWPVALLALSAVGAQAGCWGLTGQRVAENPPTLPVKPTPPVVETLPSAYHSHLAVMPTETKAPEPLEQVRFPTPESPPATLPAIDSAPKSAPADAPLVEALRCVLRGEPSAALELLQRYDAASREVILALLQLAAPLGEGGLERVTPEERAVLLDQANAVAAALRKRSPLVLDKMCFCRSVSDFGKFEPLPRGYAFRTGSGGRPGERVLVYVEVRNFTCRARGSFYETALKGRLEIRDFNNELVWLQDLKEEAADRSLTPRQDYCLRFEFFVPPRLPPDSSYTLWIQVDDAGAEGRPPRRARQSLDFRVRAPRASLSANTAD